MSMLRSDADDEKYLARGFRDVDGADARKMAFCLEYLDSLPAVQQYKAEALRLLDPQAGAIAADLGCGLGADVRRIARAVGPEGTAIGIDSSNVLLESARSSSKDFPNAEFIRADIRELPLPDGILSCCKIDRVLQHVEGPQEALREMFRIVSAGGKVVCVEPDWGTFSIEHGDQAIAAEIASSWAESFQNPRMGRDLKTLLSKAGFVQVEVQEHILATVSFRSSDVVFDIAQSVRRLAGDQRPELLEWLSNFMDPGAQVRCLVTLVIHSARKP
jgi:ubiquinone/menaquinone biosynthesis C-methylase UbiE